MARFLIGDIGGTNTRLALFEEVPDGQIKLVNQHVTPSSSWPCLEDAVSAFVKGEDREIEAAGFGIAGPVIEGVSHLTNLSWTVDHTKLAAALGLAKVTVINDLEAVAYGLNELTAGDLLVLNEGDPDAVGNRAVIAAGTGCGQAGLFWDAERREHMPFACEGGHTGFSPATALQLDLARYLMEKEVHPVSWENILSGRGLHSIFEFLCQRAGLDANPSWLATAVASGKDASAVISEYGLTNADPTCDQTLELFVELYGFEAANLALKLNARGGLYIAGGIAPKIRERLVKGFMTAFRNNRQVNLLAKIPVRIVLNGAVGMLGAARRAMLQRSTLVKAV